MADCDSERIWKVVESYRQNVPKRRHQSDDPPSLFDRLYDRYVECNQTGSEKLADKRFRNAVNLLERLSPNHAHPSLIVNLYPDEQGYSLVLSPKKGSETEEFFLPYEDNEIFSYLDNQELPPVLVEVLRQTEYCHMYNGCVVCEVRDHRSFSCPSGSYDRHLLLLRPTTETILSTVEEMAYENGCSAEEKLFLESKLLLATQPPICLDPSTDVVCFTNRLQYNQRKFHTPAIRRTLRKRSHARRARMHMTSEGVAPRGLQLHDFIAERTKSQPRERWREAPAPWKKRKVDHQLQDTPETILASILRLTKQLTPPPESPLPTSHRPSGPQGGPPGGPPGTISTAQRPPTFTTQPSAPQIPSQPVSVPSEVPPMQGPPPHPPAPPPSHHPQLPPHLPLTPAIAEQQQQTHSQQPPPPISIPIQQPPRLAPPPLTTPPPITAPPSMAQPPPVATISAVVPSAPPIITTTAASTTVTPPPAASQPPPPTPTPPPPPLVQQPVPPPPPITPPVPVTIATPTAISQPPPAAQPSTSQPLYSAVGGLQLPPGLQQLPPAIATNPELLKLFIAQMHAQAAASAAAVAVAAGSRQNKPRPIAPAVTPALGGGAPVVIKSKSPAVILGTPPPLSGVAGASTAAASAGGVVVSRPGGSTMVQVSPQVRPPLHSLTTPTPPSLTPSPKRPLPSLSSQTISPAQAGMPKLHPLAQELSSVQQKSSLPPQPALTKPTIPPPPSLSSSTPGPGSVVAPGGGAKAPPPAMPTLHKISATPTPPVPPPQAVPQQTHIQQQQKATPTMGGASIPAPPLKANPTSGMPKLTTSLGQQINKPAPTGLPILSRAPMALQPPPGTSRPHPQPRPLTHPQQATSSVLSGSGFQLKPLVKATSSAVVPPLKLSTGTKPSAAPVSSAGKSTKKHGGSSGKTGKSHGSGSKKKKK